ncbi:unnamed protein product [Thelazia callipaeda]|uniref:ADP-ribosylation factor-like protein 6 n=1 Tax=Thelazia callipaeda TaxID=103827 RepID=A0A0N5CRY8_THECL|nr:unnamed protein product [Thelazia callipaeda]
MGLLSQITTALKISRKSVNILVVGLDNSGKSTIINHMKPSDARNNQITSTIGYVNEQFFFNNTKFLVLDMSGQGKYRNLWESHYKEIDGVIFVIDSTDQLRIAVARDELWLLLNHSDFMLRKVPILVFANKMEVNGSLTTSEISLFLGLNLISDHNWEIYACCAITGQGLNYGFQWLLESIQACFEAN